MTPGQIEISRLEEAFESRPGVIEQLTGLIGLEEIQPVLAALLVLFNVCLFVHSSRHSGYAEVVIAIF